MDKTFVDEINGGDGRSSLLETMVNMAHVLGLEVVAEGVETSAQEEYLRQHGCDFGQGYLFSKPVMAEELSVLLAETRPHAAAQAGSGISARPGTQTRTRLTAPAFRREAEAPLQRTRESAVDRTAHQMCDAPVTSCYDWTTARICDGRNAARFEGRDGLASEAASSGGA
ncbi:MAG: EAL domain-containing protein [Candidatus Dormibacteraeota bacterium]|nr:EAL domain-containing protein [Candidatus Dormibacteraeota bacterium]